MGRLIQAFDLDIGDDFLFYPIRTDTHTFRKYKVATMYYSDSTDDMGVYEYNQDGTLSPHVQKFNCYANVVKVEEP